MKVSKLGVSFLVSMEEMWLFDEYLTKCIIELYKNATPYASGGRIICEGMLYGPGGGVMIQTIQEGTKIIKVYIFG